MITLDADTTASLPALNPRFTVQQLQSHNRLADLTAAGP